MMDFTSAVLAFLVFAQGRGEDGDGVGGWRDADGGLHSLGLRADPVATTPYMLLQRFQATSGIAQHPEVQVLVPSGWKVISGGAVAHYNADGALLTKSIPLMNNSVPQGWIAASKDHGNYDPHTLTVYAVALYDPNNDWDVTVNVAQLGSPVPFPEISVMLQDGYALTGGGAFDVWTGQGNLLVKSRPGDDSQSWIAGGKEHRASSPATMKAYAIGVRTSATRSTPTCALNSATSQTAQHPNVTVAATSGRVIVGGGAAVSQASGLGNMLVGLIPSSDGSSFSAMSKDHMSYDPERLTAYAIECTNAGYGTTTTTPPPTTTTTPLPTTTTTPPPTTTTTPPPTTTTTPPPTTTTTPPPTTTTTPPPTTTPNTATTPSPQPPVPPCGSQINMTSGNESKLVSANYPNNFPIWSSCTWLFTCPGNMILKCGTFQLPSSYGCYKSAFIYNWKRVCGNSTELQSGVNVGTWLSIAFFSRSLSAKGFQCVVACT